MDKHVIKAEEFVLVDKKGQTLAVLSGGEQGGSTLCFFDQAGARRCLVGVDSQGTPLITLGDEGEQPCLCLSQDKENASFKVMDKTGEVRVQVGVDGIRNHSFVTLGRAQDQNQLVLFANEDGSTSVILHDGNGTPLLGLRVHPNGDPALLVGQLGDILQTLRHFATTSDSHSDGEGPLHPQGVEEVSDEVPDDDRMVDSPHEDQADAWDGTGLVRCD